MSSFRGFSEKYLAPALLAATGYLAGAICLYRGLVEQGIAIIVINSIPTSMLLREVGEYNKLLKGNRARFSLESKIGE